VSPDNQLRLSTDPTVLVERLSKLGQQRNPPNSQEARTIMDKIRPIAAEIDLDLATKAVQAAGMLLLDEPRFFMQVASRFIAARELHDSKRVRRMISGLGEVGFEVPGVSKAAQQLAAEGLIEAGDLRRFLRGAAMSIQDDRDFAKLWNPLKDQLVRFAKGPGTVRLLYTIALARNVELPAALDPLKEQFAHEVLTQTTPPNGFELDVARYLTKAGYKFRSNCLLHGVDVDFLIDQETGPVAFFCDGVRYHRVGGTPTGSLSGKDRLFRRALENAGVRVSSLSDWQFNDPRFQRAEVVKNVIENAPPPVRR
jgi:hypothetical protein